MVAAMVADDAAHERCSPLLKPDPERRVLPAPVLVELDHLLGRELGPDAFPALLDTIRVGELDVENLIASDYERAAELMRTYADLEVGFVDCAVLAVTERLGEPRLATLDHRHFGTMRPRHIEALGAAPRRFVVGLHCGRSPATDNQGPGSFTGRPSLPGARGTPWRSGCDGGSGMG